MWLMIKELEGVGKEAAMNKEIYLPDLYPD
jgi:hypothetical protein